MKSLPNANYSVTMKIKYRKICKELSPNVSSLNLNKVFKVSREFFLHFLDMIRALAMFRA